MYLQNKHNLYAGEVIGDAKSVMTRGVDVPAGSTDKEYPRGTVVYMKDGIAYPCKQRDTPYGVVYSNINITQFTNAERLINGTPEAVDVVVEGVIAVKCKDTKFTPNVGDYVDIQGRRVSSGIVLGVCDAVGQDTAGNTNVAVRIHVQTLPSVSVESKSKKEEI